LGTASAGQCVPKNVISQSRLVARAGLNAKPDPAFLSFFRQIVVPEKELAPAPTLDAAPGAAISTSDVHR
jgi:hypothetical protein